MQLMGNWQQTNSCTLPRLCYTAKKNERAARLSDCQQQTVHDDLMSTRELTSSLKKRAASAKNPGPNDRGPPGGN